MKDLTRALDSSATSESGMETFFKRQLLRRLSGLPRGRLIIEDGGEQHVLGGVTDPKGLTAIVNIHSMAAYRDIAIGGSMGAADAFIEGKWSSPVLVDVIRLMSANIDFLNNIDDSRSFPLRWLEKGFHWLNRNTQVNSKKNIARHYDLSNDFFKLFLDPTMMYSSAVFSNEHQCLDSAATAKLDLVCLKLDLKPSDHLLEIGTGWGGLAIHAAKHYGCRVTTTTISRRQYDEAQRRVALAGLDNQIEVLFEDYRDLQGQYDKLVSIEMIEAVGPKYYDKYFSTCSSLLKPDGVMLIQMITIPEQRYDFANRSVDFIQKYIFPGGSLPCHQVVLSSVKKYTDMQLVDMQEIGIDYAKTLAEWRVRFWHRIDEVKALGFDEQFIRMWDYYFCYCEGGFRERIIGTAQILLARPDWRPQT
jgi:cyclopropane-fatty-acyl-phospholipid synthase